MYGLQGFPISPFGTMCLRKIAVMNETSITLANGTMTEILRFNVDITGPNSLLWTYTDIIGQKSGTGSQFFELLVDGIDIASKGLTVTNYQTSTVTTLAIIVPVSFTSFTKIAPGGHLVVLRGKSDNANTFKIQAASGTERAIVYAFEVPYHGDFLRIK